MRVEKGIHLSVLSLEELKGMGALDSILERFDCVHMGPEFCEHNFPPDEDLLGLADFFHRNGKKVCFMTPVLSEKGLARLDGFLESFRRFARERVASDRFEISVNDYGALQSIAEKGIEVKINAGRLLQYDVFMLRRNKLSIQNRYILDHFESKGVSRFEISTIGTLFDTNLADSKRFGFKPQEIGLSLYYPYMNLASTRACFLGMKDGSSYGPDGALKCELECRACAFEMGHHRVRDKFVIQGNTLFLHFPKKFYSTERELLERRVNRLVYCPFP